MIPRDQVPLARPRRLLGLMRNRTAAAIVYRSASRSVTDMLMGSSMRFFISGKADPQAALTNNRSTAPRRGRGAATTAMHGSISLAWTSLDAL
ncbi:hypothetical protein GCM10010404_69490 [Nonomuraea africana]